MSTNRKQVSNRNTSKLIQIGINAIDATQLDEQRVAVLALTIYQADHLEYDARTVFAQWLDCSEMHISHVVAGSAKFGDKAWAIIVSRSGQKTALLRQAWLEELTRRYPQSTT